MKDCGDCGVSPGQPHEVGCDVARCMWTGTQAIGCSCRALRESGHADLADELAHYLSLDDPDHDCGRDVWTGRWPGEAECEEFGWWSYFGPPWTRCRADHPGAGPDLNRLHREATWDRQAGRWMVISPSH